MAVAVLTRSYDNTRAGANTEESTLTPTVVARGLRKLFSFEVDDDPRLEAQPLIVPGVKLNDGSTHDVVYVCTMANNVWAFDANDGSRLWPRPVNLGTPIQGSTAIDSHNINKLWGILSTPVVDIDSQTLYVINWSLRTGTVPETIDPVRGPNKTQHRLHALKLSDGTPRQPPIEIAPKATTAGGAEIDFISIRQKQRAALLLVPLRQGSGPPVKKTLFMGCGQTQESLPNTHGWVAAFDAAGMKQIAAFCTTPNGTGGGVWAAGQGPSADAQGNVYVMTGNGAWNSGTDFGESFVKLKATPPTGTAPGRLDALDWFTPFRDKDRGVGTPTNLVGINFKDQDLGSAAPLVLEEQGIVLGAGKDGVLYVLDKNNMGKAFRDFSKADSRPDLTKLKSPPIFFTFFPGLGLDASDEHVLDQFVIDEQLRVPRGKTHHLHGSPLFWKSPDLGPMLFCWGENENLRAWGIDATGKVTFLAMGHEQASAFSANPGGMPGGMLTLSADGTNPGTGVVWATVPLKGNRAPGPNGDNGDANAHVVEGILFAYDATSFGTNGDGSKFLKLLWNSHQIAGNTFSFSKFCPPVVANGKVYVTTYDGRVDVYGP
jgi:outer membrane protein assembly factor BamB